MLASNNMDMFAVSVFEEYIYWSDRSVLRCSLKYLLTHVNQCLLFLSGKQCKVAFCCFSTPHFRTHANGSIKRGSKDNATDAVQLRTGIGVQLKDIKVFNRARQQGRH